MSRLRVSGLTKRFDGVTALDGVSLDIADGEFFCVVGPTNAGKSTLLKTIAGLHAPDAGRIAIGGREVTRLPPRDRHLSLLFQAIALFPTLTGYRNIAFPLRAAGLTEAEIDRRVRSLADLLKIEHLLDRLPRTFSGGEQQRTAIGRALARPGDLLMLDEPLTNLDARIRIALRIAFKALHRDTRQTILYVTHDQVEAMSLSDRIGVLHEGRFQQIGTPEEIYHRPANRFVARFVGTPPMNILDAEITEEGGRVVLRGDGFSVPGPDTVPSGARSARQIGVGIRPEAIAVAPAPTTAAPLPGRVAWIERLGAKSVLDIALGGSRIKAVVPEDHPVDAEGQAWIGFTPQSHHLLDPRTGAFFR